MSVSQPALVSAESRSAARSPTKALTVALAMSDTQPAHTEARHVYSLGELVGAVGACPVPWLIMSLEVPLKLHESVPGGRR